MLIQFEPAVTRVHLVCSTQEPIAVRPPSYAGQEDNATNAIGQRDEQAGDRVSQRIEPLCAACPISVSLIYIKIVSITEVVLDSTSGQPAVFRTYFAVTAFPPNRYGPYD